MANEQPSEDAAPVAAAGSERTRAYFDAIAPRYDREYARPARQARDALQPLVAGGRRPGRVLVLGVGTGRELPALEDDGWEVVCLDFSPRMLDECKKRGRSATLLCADFFGPWPVEDGSVDGAVALHGSAAHPPHREAVVSFAREAARVLRPGGRLVLELPLPAWLEATLTPMRAENGMLRDWAAGAGPAPIAVYGFRDRMGAEVEIPAVPLSVWVHALHESFDVELHEASRRVAGVGRAHAGYTTAGHAGAEIADGEGRIVAQRRDRLA